jgi:N utilization substance protein B
LDDQIIKPTAQQQDERLDETAEQTHDNGAGLSRRKARAAALQLLYARNIRGDEGGLTPEDDYTLYDLLETDRDDPELAYTRRTVRAVESLSTELDEVISKHLTNWSVERLTRIDRLILRIAAHELLYKPDEKAEDPPAVAIACAMELARTYSTEEAVTFIHGVLSNIQRSKK